MGGGTLTAWICMCPRDLHSNSYEGLLLCAILTTGRTSASERLVAPPRPHCGRMRSMTPAASGVHFSHDARAPSYPHCVQPSRAFLPDGGCLHAKCVGMDTHLRASFVRRLIA